MKQFLYLTTALLLTFFACTEKNEEPEEVIPVVDRVLIVTPPSKTEYYEGDQYLDLTGLEINLRYSDSRLEKVVFKDFEKYGIECSPAHGEYMASTCREVRVKHISTKLFAAQPVSILGVKVVSLALKELPTKSSYYLGHPLDLSGMKVEFGKNNGKTEVVDFADFGKNVLSCNYKTGDTLTAIPNIVVAYGSPQGAIYLTIDIPIKIEKAIDIDGNEYPLTAIGNQIWMAENLRTSKLNDGSTILEVRLGDKNAALWSTIPSPVFAYDSNNKGIATARYGAYYNFYCVATDKLCPDGYHVATNQDWQTLVDFIAQTGYSGREGQVLASKTGWKEISTWVNYKGLDKYGFNAKPAGFILQSQNDQIQYNMQETGKWWTGDFDEESFEGGTYTRGVFRSFYVPDAKLYKYNGFVNEGHTVRCIKD